MEIYWEKSMMNEKEQENTRTKYMIIRSRIVETQIHRSQVKYA